MNGTVVIDPGERGFIHLFAVDLPEAELRMLASQGPTLAQETGPARPYLPAAAALLGQDGLDLDRIELFPVRDLTGLGLANYLNQAYDISTAQLAPHRATLEGLTGFVLILPSEAAPDGLSLTLHTALRLVARLETPKAAISMQRLQSETGRGFAGPTGGGTPTARPRAPARLILLLGIVLLGLAVWLWLTL